MRNPSILFSLQSSKQELLDEIENLREKLASIETAAAFKEDSIKTCRQPLKSVIGSGMK